MAEPLYKQNIWNRDEDQSILEIYDVETHQRTVVAEMDYCIEAPNWTPDGKALIYNSNGCMFRIDLETKEIQKIEKKRHRYRRQYNRSMVHKKLFKRPRFL